MRTKSTPRPIFVACSLIALTLFCLTANAQEPESLAPLHNGVAPTNFSEMWGEFDPRAEPLEVETPHQWVEDDVTLRIVRFRIGVFKGQKASLAAIYGFPNDARQRGEQIPGLLQIHGGGQYADHSACVANAKRGYATLSIAWAGRLSAPEYRVTPNEMQLFWDGKTDDPAYKLTTDWGAVDGYHAPSRNTGNQFPSAKAAAWTLDVVESPRNSSWFLCALAARRALTFLEDQEEVDPARLGVYGHSMGGKLTVMTAVDSRVKAAAPSCGGISDRDTDSDVFRSTLNDDISLEQISCPIVFLSPANDFHGRIGDLPQAIDEIQSPAWRVTCSPHHNHQDTAPYEVATLLWFDEHLKQSFALPKTPLTQLILQSTDGVPIFEVTPDSSQTILSVDVFYTQHGIADETPSDRDDTVSRFWHHATAVQTNGVWSAKLPLTSATKPLWVYANVRYPLASPIAGVGYYYGKYEATDFNVSSLLQQVTADELAAAGAQATLAPSLEIEDFQGDWEKEWFTYRPAEWARSTYKLHDATWKGPNHATLSLEVRSIESNKLVVLLDDFAAEVPLTGGDIWQQIELSPTDFQNAAGESLTNWDSTRLLKLTPAEHLKVKDGEAKRVGGDWKGATPQFRNLKWQIDSR